MFLHTYKEKAAENNVSAASSILPFFFFYMDQYSFFSFLSFIVVIR